MCLLWFYVVWLHVSWLCELQVMIRQQAPSLGFSSPWPNTRSTSREHRQRLTPSWRAGTLRKLNGKVFGFVVMIYGRCRIDPFNQWSKYRTIFPLLIFFPLGQGQVAQQTFVPKPLFFHSEVQSVCHPPLTPPSPSILLLIICFPPTGATCPSWSTWLRW